MFGIVGALSLSISLLASAVHAGCQPELAFLPPRLDQASLSGVVQQIQSLFDQYTASGAFNATSFSLEISSSQGGLFSAHNTANTSTVAVNSSSVYRIASNTKLFTALGILQQEAAGNLSLDDLVTDYISDLSSNGDIDWSSITLQSLLGHLGGIPDICKQNLLGHVGNMLTTPSW